MAVIGALGMHLAERLCAMALLTKIQRRSLHDQRPPFLLSSNFVAPRLKASSPFTRVS